MDKDKEGSSLIGSEIVSKDASPKEIVDGKEGLHDVALPENNVRQDIVHETFVRDDGQYVEKYVVTEARQLMDAFEALCKEVLDVQPELVSKVDELRKLYGASVRIPVEPIKVKEKECFKKNHEEVTEKLNHVNSQPRIGTAGAVDNITYEAYTQPSTITQFIDAMAYVTDPPSLTGVNCHVPDTVR